MFQSYSDVRDPNIKTLLLWTPWFQQFASQRGIDHTSWMITNLGYSWEDQTHSDLEDFGCDRESYKCTITSNR